MADDDTTAHPPEHADKPRGPAGLPHPHGTVSDTAGKKGITLPGGKKIPKEGIIVALTAAGVLLAYLTLKKTPGKAAGTTDTGGGGASDGTSSAMNAGYYPSGTGGGGFVDGSASGTDPSAMDGLSSYLDNLSSQISALSAGQVGTDPSSTTTTASTSSGTTATKSPYFDYAGAATDKYVKNRADGSIYQVDPNGELMGLNPGQWASIKARLGKRPTTTEYGHAKTPAPAKPPPLYPIRKVATPIHHGPIRATPR